MAESHAGFQVWNSNMCVLLKQMVKKKKKSIFNAWAINMHSRPDDYREARTHESEEQQQ